MRKPFIGFKGLKGKILIYFSVLIMAILVFMEVATYYIMRPTISDINNNFLQVELRQKNEKLNNFIKDLDDFSKTIISDKDTINQLTNNYYSGITINGISQNMEYVLPNNIDAVFLISKEGNFFSESENELKEYVKKNIKELEAKVAGTKGEMVFIDSRFIHYTPDNNGDYLFFAARKIRSIDNFEDIGIMFFAVRESMLWKSICMDGEMGDFYIVNSDGKIISHKDKAYIEKNVSQRLEKQFTSSELKSEIGLYVTKYLVINSIYNQQTQWTLMNSVTIDQTNSNFKYIQNMIIIIGLLAIVIAVYISVLISGNVTRPIRDLTATMKKVSNGDLNAKTDMSLTKGAAEEVIELNEVFNHMTTQLQALLEEVYNQGLREKDAELRALKAQIQPHFLYNTLDTVYWMLIDKSEYDIAQIITKLGEILRYSIKKGSTYVLVKDEITQISNYLFLQQTRFEDNLNYQINIDDSIYECQMPSFIIQPFVENAINHGIMQEKGSGSVTINGYKKGKNLIFEVLDDGCGMTGEEIDKIFKGKPDGTRSHGGIGVLNVHERIQYYYGNDYGVRIESEVDLGTKITIEIPA